MAVLDNLQPKLVFKYFEEILSGMEGLEIIPGNHGNNLPIYLANVRGYYMTAYRKLKKAGNA